MDDRQNSLPFRRLSVAVAGAAALVALSVGGAIAANSDDEPSAEPSMSTTLPPGDGATDVGTVGGSGGSGGGRESSPRSSSQDDPPITDDPTDELPPPSALAELNRRIAELDKRVADLPTKKEPAEAL